LEQRVAQDQLSTSFPQSVDIHRVVLSFGCASSDPVELSAVITAIRSEGVALSLTDNELPKLF
jgi:hypothetical protein